MPFYYKRLYIFFIRAVWWYSYNNNNNNNIHKYHAYIMHISVYTIVNLSNRVWVWTCLRGLCMLSLGFQEIPDQIGFTELAIAVSMAVCLSV